MAREIWEAKIADSISGIIFIKARKRGRGPWLEYDDLPQRVKDYLQLERLPGRAGHVKIGGVRNIDELEEIIVHYGREHERLTRQRGNQATLWFEVDAESRPARPRIIPRGTPAIRSLQDLMNYFSAERVTDLNRRIYRGTECGASISVRTPDGVWHHNGQDWSGIEEITAFTIQTIVEGSDAEVNSAPFVLPVTEEEVENWITHMESEADSLWREANSDWPEEEESDQNWPEVEEVNPGYDDEDPPSVKNWRPE